MIQWLIRMFVVVLILASTDVQAQMLGGMPITTKALPNIPGVVPANLTLGQNARYVFLSVYDQDYAPYNTPIGVASTAIQAADGINDELVNIQGTLSTTGVNVFIPISATGSGTLPAYSTTTVVPASLTEDGISRSVTLSWSAQNYTNGTTRIIANIKSVGGVLNAKKLDINAGIGNDVLGVVLARLSYPINNVGNASSFQLRAISAIPDKLYGLADNYGSTTNHNIIYLPVQGEDNRIWLNSNLGTSAIDGGIAYWAYGSLFQWGRRNDGHELVTWASATQASWSGGVTGSLSGGIPSHPYFISRAEHPTDWRVPQDATLWQTESSPSNPCPRGFRVPTFAELANYMSAAGVTGRSTAANCRLRLTVPGWRDAVGNINGSGSSGHYWTSSTSGEYGLRIFITDTETMSGGALGRSFGCSVRCIADN